MDGWIDEWMKVEKMVAFSVEMVFLNKKMLVFDKKMMV